MKKFVLVQLQEVTWKCSNTYVRMAALWMKILVLEQLEKVTWNC